MDGILSVHLLVMLVLASASPARRRLLEQAGITHQVQVSGVDEQKIADPDPLRLVQRLAAAKADAVADTLATTSAGDATAVLGCDSVLVFEGEVHGKPADAAAAIARWQRMAGHWGELHTGHCLISLPVGPEAGLAQSRLAVVTTRVQFAAVTVAEIQAYVATGEPLQCAGGFALEGRGGLMVERIEGCFSNVIGLSLPLLRRWLSCPAGC
jgi:septum formation protein